MCKREDGSATGEDGTHPFRVPGLPRHRAADPSENQRRCPGGDDICAAASNSPRDWSSARRPRRRPHTPPHEAAPRLTVLCLFRFPSLSPIFITHLSVIYAPCWASLVGDSQVFKRLSRRQWQCDCQRPRVAKTEATGEYLNSSDVDDVIVGDVKP
jgi:hypothetical protein